MKDISKRKYIQSEYLDESVIQELMLRIYPVGSIYMSENPNNPSELFGGEWIAWGGGRVPVGYDIADTDFNVVGNEGIGGSKSNYISYNHLPQHVWALYNNPKSHTGTYTALTGGTGATVPVGYSVTGAGKQWTTETKQGISTLQPYIVCYMWKRIK